MDESDVLRALGPLPLSAGEAADIVAAILAARPSAIRLNTLGRPLAADALPFVDSPVPWYPWPAFFCRADARPARHPLYAAGAWYVQDAASLLPVALLDPRPGERVCDLCASPGGKATAILERLGEAGGLLVNEPVQSRLPPLLLNLARHGSTRWALTRMDPDRLAAALGPTFDAVLVDAPCSAQSLAARDDNPARPFDARTIEHCAARQARILDAAVCLLRPGGRLVYSTCTFSWAENEGQVAGLLARHPRLRPGPVAALDAYRSGDPTTACYRLWPHRDGCAGGFAARLIAVEGAGAGSSGVAASAARRKREGGDAVEPERRRGRRPAGRNEGHHRPFARGDEDAWGRWRAPVAIDTHRDRAFGWVAGLPDAWRGVAVAAPEVAYAKGRTWFPSYALAMRRDGAFEPRAAVDLAPGLVSRFLAGESVPGPDAGWLVVCVEGHPVGWAKGDGRILTNHLPKPARLVIEPLP